MTLLTILIPSIIERNENLKRLLRRLNEKDQDVQICCYIDNKKQSIGEKRNILLSMIQSEYFTFLDDDDDIEDDYFAYVLETIKNVNGVDVITFKQGCFKEGQDTPCFVVDADMTNGCNEPIPLEGPWKKEYKRLCWHWCVFRTEVFGKIKFENSSYYEDIVWLRQVYPLIKTQYKINNVLHRYKFLGSDSQTTKTFF